MAHRRNSIAYANTGVTGGTATTVASRNTSLPTAAKPGQFFVLRDAGTADGDRVYIYVYSQTAAKFDWVQWLDADL